MDDAKQSPKAYLLPEDVRNGLLQYLGGRPYVEVANGMALLLGLKELPAAPAPASPPPLEIVPQEPPMNPPAPVPAPATEQPKE